MWELFCKLVENAMIFIGILIVVVFAIVNVFAFLIAFPLIVLIALLAIFLNVNEPTNRSNRKKDN